MKSTFLFYAKMSALLVALSLIVGGDLAVRGLWRYPKADEQHVPASDPKRGRVLLFEYGCVGCHTIPGVPNATGTVGPPLDRLKHQVYIAGVLPNTPQDLIYWIQDPKKADPRTVMPDLNVGAQDARDMAAYLYSLD